MTILCSAVYIYMHTSTRQLAVHMPTMKTENLETNAGQVWGEELLRNAWIRLKVHQCGDIIGRGGSMEQRPTSDIHQQHLLFFSNIKHLSAL